MTLPFKTSGQQFGPSLMGCKKVITTHEKLERGINSRRTNPNRGNIQRGIFQGDSLSLQLFVIAMVPRNYILIHWRLQIYKNSGRVFANGPRDRGSVQGRVILKTRKWYLAPPCLTFSFIRYVSRVKCNNPEKRVPPYLHLCVVAIEKGAFGMSSKKL